MWYLFGYLIHYKTLGCEDVTKFYGMFLWVPNTLYDILGLKMSSIIVYFYGYSVFYFCYMYSCVWGALGLCFQVPLTVVVAFII